MFIFAKNLFMFSRGHSGHFRLWSHNFFFFFICIIFIIFFRLLFLFFIFSLSQTLSLTRALARSCTLLFGYYYYYWYWHRSFEKLTIFESKLPSLNRTCRYALPSGNNAISCRSKKKKSCYFFSLFNEKLEIAIGAQYAKN